MRASSRTFVALGALLLLFVSCRQPPPPTGTGADGQDSSQLLFLDRPVKFCWRKPAQPKSGGVQILLDSSGSMVGFKPAIAPLVNWMQHSISQLQTSTLSIENSRLCQFEEKFGPTQGIGNCTALNSAPARYEPASNTNLHVAIRSAKDYGLSFIFTDGVAATGGKGAGDCATGVDAACVARMLREVIGTPGSQPEDVNWGVWVMPLASTYDGLFYTEEPVAPASFDVAKTQQNVRAETGVQPGLDSPATGRDGRLNFKYRGPRMMLLIVIARWAEIGRDAVQALWERMESLRIRRIKKLEELASVSGEVASFPPIEVYPGFVERLEWKSLEGSQEPGDSSGTIDVYFVPDKQAVEMSCLKDVEGAAVYHLNGSLTEAEKVSGCVDIHIVPPLTFSLRPIQPGDADAIPQFLQSFEQEEGSYTKLRLNLSCDMSAPRPCRSNALAAQWVGLMQYGKAADALASTTDEHAVPTYLKQISTKHPSLEPHRIFGFADTLEAFYREVATEQHGVPLADLKFCHR